MAFLDPKEWSGTPLKPAVLAVLTLFIVILTVFSLKNNIQIVFTHLYYVPIIIAAYWYDKRGIFYAGIVSVFYLGAVYYFSPAEAPIYIAAVWRVVVFIGIAMVIALLSLTIRGQRDEITQSEARFRGIWESIQAGIILVDPETHTILAANPEARKMSGYSEEEMTGHSCHTFICPAEKGHCPISDRGQKVDKAERVLLARDGRKIPVLKTVTEMNIRGKPVFIENCIDISAIKDAENALIAYIREATLRIRNPIELVRDNIHDIGDDFAENRVDPTHILTALAIQEKNMDEILKTLQELERAIAEKRTEIPDALREYMKR
jgi:PAS domain S-box-containing protein